MKNTNYFVLIFTTVLLIVSCRDNKKNTIFLEQALLDTIFCNTFEGIIPCLTVLELKQLLEFIKIALFPEQFIIRIKQPARNKSWHMEIKRQYI